MLKKYKKQDSEPKVSAAPATPLTTVDRTIIGDQIFIEGIIRGKEDLLIEGSVKGSIEMKAHHLTVGSKGQVEAEVNAADVTIGGKLVGNVNASGKVKITKAADFNGEIKAKSISVEDGAYLKAVIELEREPIKKAAHPEKPEEKASSAPIKEPLIPSGINGKRI
ncbi:MAG: polymer-forming cytoskeletal protein [Desulfobacterales bacterium]